MPGSNWMRATAREVMSSNFDDGGCGRKSHQLSSAMARANFLMARVFFGADKENLGRGSEWIGWGS